MKEEYFCMLLCSFLVFFTKKMPFVSEAQRRKCYVLQTQAEKAGKKSSWDCKKFSEHDSKSIKKKTKVNKVPKRKPKIYDGPRGGKYIIKNGSKIYIV